MDPSELRLLIPAARIRERVAQMGTEIASDYGGRPLRLIAILKGACFFLSDLARAIDRDVSIDFMGIASYGRDKTSSGEVRVTKDLDNEIADLDVLIVEDIVDTGITLTYLMHVLQQRKPRSLRIATLLDKPSRRLKPVDVAYIGFQIPDEFVVGYGLDFDERYRNLADICVLAADVVQDTRR